MRALRLVHQRLGLRPFVWAAALALLGAGLGRVPLFDVLGYDYSFAIGLGAGFAAVDIGHAAAARASAGATFPRSLLVGMGGALGTLVLPLLLSLLNAFRVRNCSLGSGFAFYACLPVATVLFAAPLGTLAGAAFPGGSKTGRLLALALPVVSLLWSLVRLYLDPPVFAYDPFGGYFPGPIYDEAMRVPARLVTFRAANLLWMLSALVIYGAARTPPGRRRKVVAAAAALLGCASLAVFLERGPLGFHVTKAYLLRTLARETRTPHFVLHTDPNAGETPGDLDLVRRDLEFRYQQLERTLGVHPPGPIDVYQFPSAAAKKELVGAGGTLYAKPWMREVFVQAERFPSPRLRHELAHVFAATFGDPVFGVSLAWRFAGPLPLPRLASGLIEGIAEAADFDDPDGGSTTHEEAHALILDGHAPPLDRVLGAGFTTLSGPRAYTMSGSFCRFLLETHGAERLRALYRSAGDFTAVYGQPLAALEARWRAFLDKLPVDEAERAQAKERFRRPAIFQKICARELGARVAEARARLFAAPREAVALFESVCRDDPGEPSFRLDLADALVAARLPEQALRTATAIETDESLTRPLRARAATLAAALHFHAGRIEDARRAARRTIDLATDEGEKRTAWAKLRALEDPEARRTLGRVLFGDGPGQNLEPALTLFLVTEFARLHPAEALGPYLVGRQLSFRDPRLALGSLEQACGDARPIGLPPLFKKECHRLTGDLAFRSGDLPRSRAALTALKAMAPSEAERLRASDFLARIDWEEQTKGGTK